MILSVIKNVLKFVGKTVVYTYATIGIIITTAIGYGVLLKSDELNSGVDYICNLTGKLSNIGQSVMPFVQGLITIIK